MVFKVEDVPQVTLYIAYLTLKIIACQAHSALKWQISEIIIHDVVMEVQVAYHVSLRLKVVRVGWRQARLDHDWTLLMLTFAVEFLPVS